MKSVLIPALAAAAVLLLASRPLLAADGILIVEKTTTGGLTGTNQIQIEKTRMRAEATGVNGAKQVFIFDGATQVMRLINYDRKTYGEMTRAEVDRAGAQMATALTQLQEQMKNLPPAQRAQMEEVMKSRGMTAAGITKTEYKKTGTDKVGKWTCDKYEGFQNGQKISDVCAADPKALGFTAADFQVTQQLGEFFQKLMPQNAEQMFSLGTTDAQGFNGVPIRRTLSIGGRESMNEVTAISHQTFDDSLFAVPAGFQKQPFGL
jgi:hypothetical protein